MTKLLSRLPFQGYKTYAAAIGAIALAIAQFSQGDYLEGIKSLVGALALTGLRHAISKI